MADNYNDLNMDIRATDYASKTLDLVISKISNLKGILKSMPNFNVGKMGGASQLTKQFQQFQKTGELTKKITQFQKQQGNINVYKQAKKNIAATTELGNAQYKVARTKKILNNETKKQIDNQIKTELGLKKTNTAIKKVNKSRKSHLSILSKYLAVAVIVKKLGRLFTSTINKSGDWIEALNLFEVTMGSATKEALDFSKTLVDAYGVGYNQIVKYIGLFTQMTSAIGVQKDIAADLGQTLTAVGIDIASFYNRTTEATMEMIRAAIAGQTKPARQYGFDVTAQSLDQYLKEMGISATSKILNQKEKALLRMILILEQSRNAWGDMAKTIGSFQNQVKVLTGSLDNLKLAFGDLFIDQATAIMTFVNGLTIAVTDIIRLFKPLNTQTEFGNIIKEQTDIASEGINELNKSLGLLSFDKFEVLTTGKKDEGALSNLINEEYLKVQDEYMAEFNKRIENIKSASKKIADNIKSWFVVFDEEGGFKEWTIQAKILAGIIAGIGVAILIAFPSIAIIAGIVAITTATTRLYKNNEKFAKSVDTLWGGVKDIIIFIKPLVEDIVQSFEELYVQLKPILDQVKRFFLFLIDSKIALYGIKVILGVALAPMIAALAAIHFTIKLILKVIEGVVKYFNNWKIGIDAIGSALTDWIDNFVTGIDVIKRAFSELKPPEWLKKGINIAIGMDTGGVPAFATGGFPEDGLFQANSNELIGQFNNGKTAVVNNSQIVEGIENAVYKAMIRAKPQNENTKTQPIQVNLEIDGREFARATFDDSQAEARRRGL